MDSELKVFLAYFELKKKVLYYNQIKEFTNLSHSSLQNILVRLVEKKLLNIVKTKSNVFYEINDNKIFSLRFSELAILKFDNLNYNIKNPLLNFIKNLPNEIFTIVLFGSASKNDVSENSDIDLLIVSYKNLDLSKNKKDAELTSKYPFSLFYTNLKKFINDEDDIIVQAKKEGFPLFREQNFYEVILNGYR